MPRSRLQIACIGECMIELSRGEDGLIKQGFAGDTANVAVYLARLLPATKAQVAYVTALGQDDFSAAMLTSWAQEGIDTRRVRRLPDRLPGLYWISTASDGERSFYYWRQHSAARALLTGGYAARLRDALTGCDLICLSGISLGILPRRHRSQLLELLTELYDAGTRIAFDSNYRERVWTDANDAREAHEALLSITHAALVSFDDERRLFGDATPAATCDRLHRLGAQEVIVRHGVEPCLVSAGGERVAVSPPQLQSPVDTTAAGDSFDAAYLAARCLGHDRPAAALAGHRLAARVVAAPGALLVRAETPSLAELLDG